jgi:hypothetical protein
MGFGHCPVRATDRRRGALSTRVDEKSIAEFEADLRNNLYKLWNRLS